MAAKVVLGDITLHAHDVATLRPGGWLGDMVIAYFFERLAGSAGGGVVLLEPSTAFTAATLGDADVLREMLSVAPTGGATPLADELAAANLVLIPVNDNEDPDAAEGGGHWSLLVFRRHGQEGGAARFEYYDSLLASNLAHAKRVAATLAPLLLPQTAGDSAGRLPVACLPTPQQANGHDCGVYVIAIAAIVAGAPSEASGQPLSEAVSAAVSALTPAAITAQRREYHAHLTRALDGGGGQ